MFRQMRMIRSGTVVACAALAAAGLVACGSDDSTSTTAATSTASSSSASSTTPAAAGPDLSGKKIDYVAFNSTTYNAIGCAAKARAEQLGASFQQQNSNEFTAQSQTPVLNAALAGAPDALIASPTDPKGLYAPIMAASQKIPVATVMNNLANRDPVTTEVAFDSVSAGKQAAQYLAEQAAGKKVKVMGVSFTPGGSAAADDEVKGFEEAIKAYPNVDYLSTQYVGAQDQAGDSTKKVSAALSANPDLFGVWAQAGATGTGALAAIRQRNAKTLLVSNFSATNPDIVKALKQGDVAAIADFPYQEAGTAAVDQLANKLTGKPVQATVPFKSVLYTKASLDDPKQAVALKPATC